MTSCSKNEARRCRPLLGTFVEITAAGAAEDPLNLAVNAAFATIEKIQRLLSVHDPDSELSLLNREAANHAVTVSRETFEVLQHAGRLSVASGGAFDFTVAATLAGWGMLPADLQRQNSGSWRDVLLLRRRQVRFLRPLALDLGGIAKGFAVDKAIQTLREHAVPSALVNAGGDLRVFGSQPSVIHLRHPSNPQMLLESISICDSALATSSPCFTEKDWCGRRVSHLVDSVHQTPITGAISVSVHAGECWLADALTKVVLNSPGRAETLLAKFEAEAFMLTA